MTNKPSFGEVFIEFLLSGTGLYFIIVANIVYLISIVLTVYYHKKKNQIPESKKEEVVVSAKAFKYVGNIIIVSAIVFNTLYTSAAVYGGSYTKFFDSFNSENNIDFFNSTLNKEWFLKNQDELYRDIKENEYNIIGIESLRKIKINKEKENWSKEEMIIYNMETQSGEGVFEVEALVKEKNKKTLKIKMFAIIEEADKKENNKLTVKATKNTKEDIGKNILFGKLYLNEEIKIVLRVENK